MVLLKGEGLQARHAVDSRLGISTSYRYHKVAPNDSMDWKMQ
jgi:hypothetical protein